MQKLNLFRGLGWFIIAVVGFKVIQDLPAQVDAMGVMSDSFFAVSGYTRSKLGALFSIAAVIFGAYRVTRDVFKIDPSKASNEIAYALLQLARVLLAAGFAIAVNVSV